MNRSRLDRERGSITLWLLGLCMMLLVLGGLALDLARAFSERRALASAADAAAIAGASAIDEARYRATGEVVLVPAVAEARVRASVAEQLDRASLRSVDVHTDERSVAVVVEGNVELTLLSLVRPGQFAVRVTASAVPRMSP